jgi:hypothetical protein
MDLLRMLTVLHERNTILNILKLVCRKKRVTEALRLFPVLPGTPRLYLRHHDGLTTALEAWLSGVQTVKV